MEREGIKVLYVLGAIFLFTSMGIFSPLAEGQQIKEQEKAIDTTNDDPFPMKLTDEKIEKITKVMNRYTELKNGILVVTIHDQNKLGISEEELNLYLKGINKLNELALSGEIKIIKDESGEYVGKTIEKNIHAINILLNTKLLDNANKSLNILLDKIKEEKLVAVAGKGGGKNDFKISFHWYGVKYELWLDHYWTVQLCKWGIPMGVSIVATIISLATGGIAAPIAIAIASVIVSNIGSDYIKNKDRGNGVKFTFKDYWWTPWLPIDYWKVSTQ